MHATATTAHLHRYVNCIMHTYKCPYYKAVSRDPAGFCYVFKPECISAPEVNLIEAELELPLGDFALEYLKPFLTDKR